MNKGICKLCGDHKYLCTKSHIYPKFAYRILMDGPNGMVYLHPNEKAPRKRLDGEYEADILCQDCEEYLGRFDEYAAGLLHNLGLRKKRKFEIRNGMNVLTKAEGYDYAKFKLFIISVVWRVSISSRPFFANFSLDKNIEDDLKKMVRTGNPGAPHEYACYIKLPPLMLAVETNELGFDGKDMLFTTNIMNRKYNDINLAEFFIAGTRYRFVLNRNMPDNGTSSLQEEHLQIAFRSREEQNKLLQQMAESVKRSLGY